jgi:hypothetical protein
MSEKVRKSARRLLKRAPLTWHDADRGWCRAMESVHALPPDASMDDALDALRDALQVLATYDEDAPNITSAGAQEVPGGVIYFVATTGPTAPIAEEIKTAGLPSASGS